MLGALLSKGSLLTKLRLPRDAILFFGGLIGVWHETFIEPHIRMQALVFFGGMMGMVPALRRDERPQREPDE